MNFALADMRVFIDSYSLVLTNGRQVCLQQITLNIQDQLLRTFLWFEDMMDKEITLTSCLLQEVRMGVQTCRLFYLMFANKNVYCFEWILTRAILDNCVKGQVSSFNKLRCSIRI